MHACGRRMWMVHAYLGDPRGKVADRRDDVAPLLAPRQLRLVGEAQPHVTLVVLRWCVGGQC